ncbi:MAG: TetR/AcrR family transcriptional regulator [Pseudomonadota bacterium]
MVETSGRAEAPAPPSSRDRLVLAAMAAFRARGYAGTGVAEILKRSGLPKGSLYHHFPNGKADLAAAAAKWAGREMGGLIEATFRAAPDWRSGVETLCRRLAKLYEISDDELGCPVAGALLDGDQPVEARALAARIYDEWTSLAAGHLERLGAPEPTRTAETLLYLMQGAWVLARARRSGAPLVEIADRVIGPAPAKS